MILRSPLVALRALAAISAAALVRRPDEALRGIIGGAQFAWPPRALAMRRPRPCALPRHDIDSLFRLDGRRLPPDFLLAIQHGGEEREALVHLPPTVESARALPVIFNFHGFTSDAQEHGEYTQMNRIGAEHGFAVVHPQGVRGLFGYRAWNAGPYWAHVMDRVVDDVGFVRVLMERLESRFRIRGWFATGISNGGMLAYRLAHVLPGRFAAIAPVAAVDLTEDPIPSQTVGVLHIHGVNDGLVPFPERAFRAAALAGRLGWKRSARQSLVRFAHLNGALTSEVGHVADRRYEVWRGPTRARAQLLVHRGGHTWLGDGFRIVRRNALAVAEGTTEIVRFFIDHAMVNCVPSAAAG